MEPQKPAISSPEISYFELQAYIGTTKHMGGLETTKTLIALCHIDKDTFILEIGCGVGATTCYLAKQYGCRVIGVDSREGMIARSNERAQREGVADRVEFRVADAQDLPFEDALFDVIIAESVLTFIKDKPRVLNECTRVVKPGGRVGLNEELWFQTPPGPMVEQVGLIWDIKPDIPTLEGWRELLEDARLHDVVVHTYTFDARRESTQVQRYRFLDMWRMFYRTLFLYIKNPDFKKYVAKRSRLPKDLFKYLGYALFVGKK